MLNSSERDERLMALCELALGIPATEREDCLRAASAGDESLFEDVWDRVEWEERMGGFLLDPLIPRVELDHPFAPGQLLADRFEIVREVAEGGMAVVYEAIDRKLDQRIAIKCPRATFRRRLPPEARSALQVSHPNICRVYEIHTTLADRGEVDFLTMEFLDGETLLERLGREKRLSLEEVGNIARQICAGLEEAHRKGIIHGDLKTSNVVLTTTAEDQLRAVITDFGLAKQMPGMTGARSLTRTSQLRGTPDFVAPELWKGGPISVASDLYALGVILYESLSGERPWAGKPLNARFEGLPKAPDRLVPTVPPRWSRAVLRCLDPEPSARPRSAAVLIEELEGKRSRARVWLAAAATFLLLYLATIVWLVPWIRSRMAAQTQAIRLAVLPFEADAESAVLGSGIVHEVSTRLVRLQRGGRGMIVIPLSEVTRNRVQTPKGARSALGATHSFQAGFHHARGKLVANAAVKDAETEQTVRSFAAEYTLAETAALPKALLGTVTAALKLQGAAIPETVQPAAYADYAQGIYHLRWDAHTADRAIPFFERAAQLDPHSALPYAGMVEAQVMMFQTSEDRRWLSQAEETLKKAEARNPDAVEVRLVAGLVKQSAGWPEKALDDFRRAVQLEPANPDALRRLAEDYGRIGLVDEAVQSYLQAISVQPGYYKPYMDLGVFYYYRGQYVEALAQFQEVTKLAPALAQGHLNLGGSYTKLGRYQEAESEMREALRLREDRDTLTALGALLAYEKRHTESASLYERALASGPETHLVLSNLADSYRRTGRLSDARRAYLRALQIADRELIEDPRSGPVRAFAGYLSARLGDRARAEREIRQALRLAPEHAEVRRRAVLTYEALGNRDGTVEILENAPRTVIAELSRQPDLADLQSDSRFLNLMAQSQ